MDLYKTKKNFVINVFYGSQLGFVESVVKHFEKKIRENTRINEINVDILNNFFDYKLEEGDLCFILISTTGEGEFPNNAKTFYKRIRKEKTEHLKYSLFAFGDSNYRSFCHAGKIADRMLQKSGGEKIIDTEYYDDAIDENQKIEDWFEKNIDFINNYRKTIFDWFIDKITN
tara:strand:+ start:1145 stop:1660 length:516 start_codon:yes stop_codon:yes gene_type:complete